MRFFRQILGLLGGIFLSQAVAFRSSFRCSTVQCTYTRATHRRTSGNKQLAMGFKNPFDALKQGIAKAGAGVYDKDVVVQEMNDFKANNKVMVFSWARCPFCKKAKGLVEELLEDPSDYKFVELDERDDGNAIRYELSQMTGRTSVPQIWIGGEYVGGCNDGPGIFTLQSQGQLVPKLEAAGCKLKAA